jgi:Protein of unknown function (DUF2975)
MTQIADNRILRITKLLVFLIMGFVAVGGVVLALVSVGLPLYWNEALAEIAKEKPGIDTSSLLPGLLAVFAFGIVVLGLLWTMMRKLLNIIDSVEDGNPFIKANAARLRAIGWMMVGVQIVGLPLATAAGNVADLFGENDVGFDLPLNGILAILLVFILAGIFERGAEMREELEGTV